MVNDNPSTLLMANCLLAARSSRQTIVYTESIARLTLGRNELGPGHIDCQMC